MAQKIWHRALKIFSSLKLAVTVIISLSIVIACGTIVEAKYDALIAAKLVYRTWWMYSVLILLVVNLTAVMVDRWPWQRKHSPFIFAHIGIIVLLFGAWVTVTFGLDGNMRVGIGEKSRWVTVPANEITLYSSFDGQSFTQLDRREVDFYLHRPEDQPVSLATDQGEIKILHYEPFALATHKVGPSQSNLAGAGVRFQLANARAQFSDWLVQRTEHDQITKDLGPAQVSLVAKAELPEKSRGRNEIFLAPIGGKKLAYAIFYKEPARPALLGTLEEGASLNTGWMGLEFKVLRFFEKAEEAMEFEAVDHPSEVTNAAIKIRFHDKEHWLQLDDVVKLFTENAVYVVGFGHKRVDAGFEILLKKFTMGKYPGTNMAASYSSLVDAPEVGETTISMNEPLKLHGLTVYQASFQQDDKGEPVASVFSVNYDPGRWFKYLGSLFIVLGAISLFLNKRKAARRMGPQDSGDKNFVEQ